MALFLCNGGNGATNDLLVADFDFTKSLTDSINGFTCSLSGGVSRSDEFGLQFGATNNGKATISGMGNVCNFNGGVRFEIDVGKMNITPNNHVRFFTFNSDGSNGFIYRYGSGANKWNFYVSGWKTSSDISDVNYFANSTCKLNYKWGNIIEVYKNKNKFYEVTTTKNDYFNLGSTSNSLINTDVKALRVYLHK